MFIAAGPSLDHSYVVCDLITVLCPAPTPSRWHIALSRRVSPVPNQTVYTFRHPYAEEFFVRCRSKIFPHVHGPSPRDTGLGSPFACFRRGLTTRQCSLYAADCVLARLLSEPLSLGFNAGISPDPRHLP